MKKLLPIVLIFLTLSSWQFSQREKPGKKPEIGLLRFSVNAFDEESKKINNSIKAVKGVLDRELKKSFRVMEKMSDIVTYSDIELPEVTIDPTVEPETGKKLEKLCQKGWDGLVFGHFHQEDKLVVVTRLYLSKEKYPGIKKDDRIISAPEIVISTTGLSKDSLKSSTTQSIEKLIETVKIKVPEVFGLGKKEPSPKVTEPPKKSTQPAKQDNKATQKKPAQQKINTTPPDKKKRQTQKQIPAAADYRIQPLKAKDVYQIVVTREFYCEIVTGSPFHDEGLKGISIPGNGIFRENREVNANKKDNGLIETENRSISNVADTITLWWSPGKTNECSYQGAETTIKKLNKEYKGKDKNKRWRIPTLLEMFSIVKEKSRNHFPVEFGFPPKKDLVFWTSTPVKKEGTVLGFKKKENPYFVIESKYNSKTGQYSLTFSFKNIKGTKAYLLPVYSDKRYTYTPLKGFDTNSNTAPSAPGGKDTIPGFDKKTIKSKSTSGGAAKIPGFDSSSPKSTGKKSAPSTPPKPGNLKKSNLISRKDNTPDRIPGFDDNPDPHKKNLTRTCPEKSNNQKRFLPGNRTKLNILLFPFVDDEKMKKMGSLVFPTQANELIRLALKELKEESIKNCEIKINEVDRSFNYLIGQFYRIILDEGMSKDRKIAVITNEIIVPPTFKDIDIVVAGRFSDSGGVYANSTFLIDLINYNIPVNHSLGSLDFWAPKKFIKEVINEIVKNRPGSIMMKQATRIR